jgi:hypothetical protein
VQRGREEEQRKRHERQEEERRRQELQEEQRRRQEREEEERRRQEREEEDVRRQERDLKINRKIVYVRQHERNPEDEERRREERELEEWREEHEPNPRTEASWKKMARRDELRNVKYLAWLDDNNRRVKEAEEEEERYRAGIRRMRSIMGEDFEIQQRTHGLQSTIARFKQWEFQNSVNRMNGWREKGWGDEGKLALYWNVFDRKRLGMSTAEFCASAKDDQDVWIFPNQDPDGPRDDFRLAKVSEAAGGYYFKEDPNARLLMPARVPTRRPATPPEQAPFLREFLEKRSKRKDNKS